MSKFVLPGDEVAVVEEYIPAEGTYEHEGIIRASVAGKLSLNDNDMTATVKPVNEPNILKPGDNVFCRITDVRASMAVCEIIASDGNDRDITGDKSATIHVSKLSSEYVQDVGKEYRPGAVIRAKVLQVKPSVQLSTQEPHYGAIKALCRKCRKPMEADGKVLKCKACERTETRTIADDYGCVEF